MPEVVNGEAYDKALFACRARNPDEYGEKHKQMWDAALAEGLPIPPDYPGSIFMPCQDCGIEVQVGPRQQQFLNDGGEADIFCLICVVIHVAEQNATYDLHNLGNPHKETP